MNFALIADVMPQLMDGLLLTLALTLGAVVAGGTLAIPVALMRASNSLVLSLPAQAYTFAFRGTPLLVQLFLVYYGASQISWVRTGLLWPILRDPLWCALIAFSLNHAAYAAEILRGGIRAIPAGEVEAAKALGMSYTLRLRRLILPTGARIALPAYTNEVIMMLKASSLASTITVMEVTGNARKIVAQTFSPYEVFISAALIYLAITLLTTQVFRLLEERLSRSERRPETKTRNIFGPRQLSLKTARQEACE
ncbi:Octopine transport system permease protein OccM [compost metagenome]